MKDWQVRALKTFAQAFFGVLIPAIICVLGSAESPADLLTWLQTTAFTAISSALAAGISAVWNILRENREALIEDAQDLDENIQNDSEEC